MVKTILDIKHKVFFFKRDHCTSNVSLLESKRPWSHRQVFRSETTESSTEKVEKVDEKKHVKPEAFEEVPKKFCEVEHFWVFQVFFMGR